MSLASCIKCQEEPCICGEGYKHLRYKDLSRLAQALNTMLRAHPEHVSPASMDRDQYFGTAPAIDRDTHRPIGRTPPIRSHGESEVWHRTHLIKPLERNADGTESTMYPLFDFGARQAMMVDHVSRISLQGASNRREITGMERRHDILDRSEWSFSDVMKYPRLSLGAKFQFLEGAGADYTGEWVVTGFALYDEAMGPKLQVASVVGARTDGTTVSFYTSFSLDQVDETMVPFVSMEHIKILVDSWDVVEEPSFSDYKALKVGKSLGIAHLAADVKLEIASVEYRQKNYGLAQPDVYMVLVKVKVPIELADADAEFTFYSGNFGPMNVFFVPGADEYIPLDQIIFPE
jgi:hypothetical protein